MNRNIKIIIGVVVLIAVIGVWQFVYRNSNIPNQITIGVVAPMTGEFAIFGENMTRGIQLAKEEYVKKNPSAVINLVIEDDQGVAPKAISALNKLRTIDNIVALISATLAAPNDAMYDIVVEDKLPTINIGVSGRAASKDNVFQASPDGNHALVEFAKYLTKNMSFSNTVIIYENSVAGNNFFKAFSDAYDTPYTAIVSQGTANIRDTATKIISGNFDAIVFLMNPQSGALLTKEILTLKGDKQISLVYDAQLQTGFGDYERILGDTNMINGAISLYFKGGDAESFKEAYKIRYGSEPGFLADFGYDSFNVLIDAWSQNPEKWVNNIENTKTSGPSGDILFDENGVRFQSTEINTIKEGRVVPII